MAKETAVKKATKAKKTVTKKVKKVEEEVKKVIDKNAPVYSFDTVIKGEEGEESTYRIVLKKPTRTLLADADMYYSIQLSKYIKMGLLTAEQLAKRQVDIGGTFSEEQQRDYSRLQSLMAEKEEMYFRLMAQKEALSPDEEERKLHLYEDLAMLKTQTMDYEYIRNQVYEHTANSKARNDVILWWILEIATVGEVIEEEETVLKEMFSGDNYETKKLSMNEMEDEEDKVLTATFSQMVKIITLWYWMGISDRGQLKELSAEANA